MILKDEYAIVLDFLPHGHGFGKPEPIAQVIGTKYFSLLEVVPRKGVVLKPEDEVYIGEGKREEIDHIKRRINYEALTAFAKSELPHIVEKLVEKNEERFVEFFNKAQPITTRLHQLELLPGIGKKHMWGILEERKKEPFKSFEDLKNRVKLLPDPKSTVVKRILLELEGKEDKYRIFTVGPQRRF
jgi:putative nucleotide binding protein